MSNIFKLHPGHDAVDEWLHLNNGSTAVLIDVLALGGSALARTEREKEIVVWLAEHDQAMVGRGTVGFDISDIPWTAGGFEDEKRFLLAMIRGARDRTGWHALPYEPDADRVIQSLEGFERLILRFESAWISPASYQEWRECQPGVPPGFPRCAVHDVLQTGYGCVICNQI